MRGLFQPLPSRASSTSRVPRAASGRGDWFRIGLMGAVLAGLVFAFFFYDSKGEGEPPPPGPVVTIERTPVPELDTQMLGEIRDATREQRLLLEPGPYAHLLEKSLSVVPAVAKALGMPAEPVPLQRLRTDPEKWRGHYLWYKGVLKHLSEPRPTHPIANYRVYEGHIETVEGDMVLFAVSVPPAQALRVGDWVRVEGFFMKLRDMHLPVAVDQAPLLVGPELIPAFADWKPVDQLDAQILARVDDFISHDGVVIRGDTEKNIFESQDVPLWHLASYAKVEEERIAGLPPKEKQELPTFNTEQLWSKAFHGEIAKGTPQRLVGILKHVRIVEAKANPLGIEHWSEVWLLNRGFGVRPFAVWVPRRVTEFLLDDSLVAYGYFFKRYAYAGHDYEERKYPHYAPLFVAADVHAFDIRPNEASTWVAWGAAGVVLLLVGLFFFLARGDRRERDRHEEQLVERRRRRRARGGSGTAGGGGDVAGAPQQA